MRKLAPLLLILATACDGADAQSESAAWYSADELLQNLRPEDRRAATASIRPLSLEQLPLYDLTLTLADDQATFEMTEDVYYTNTSGAAQDTVVLRLYANAVGTQPQVRLTGSECVGSTCQVQWDRRSTFEVRPSEPLAVGGRIRIRLQLEGTLRHIDASRNNMMAQAMEGLARQGGGGEHGDYGLLAHGSGVASLGNFYAMVAPFRNGDWVRADRGTMGDLGADGVCHFRARVRAKAGTRVAITGQITSDETHLGSGDSPGRQEVHAVAGMVRNFAIVAGEDLEVATRQQGPVEIRSWFMPSDRAKGMAALDAAENALRIFQDKFGRYPYTDFELAEAPLVGGAGGVEFSGLVTVATMFYKPAIGGGALGALGGMLGGAGGQNPMTGMMDAMLEFVVAHEVAHQWWHGIVGSDAREHPFVDESLAQFSAMLYMEERYGAERAEREGARQVAGNYHMMRIQGGVDAPVDQPAADFANETAYAGIVYGKGPYLYPALREVLGTRLFYRQVRGYVNDHRFRVAAPRALFDRMATGRHSRRVRQLERHWLDETHGDADLGEGDMNRMLEGWMGEAAGIGNMLEQLRGVAGQGGSTAGAQDANRALQDLVRQLETLGQ